MNEAIVHFSGGTDSTLSAAMLLESGYKVHLLTYDRKGFIGVWDYTQDNYQSLCAVYGEERIKRKIVDIDYLHRLVCYKNYFQLVARYKTAVTALTFSKLAMHFYSALYAVENKISVVADGAVPYMKMYPDQNEIISMKRLYSFYGHLGIEYQNPVFNFGEEAEGLLFEKGISSSRKVRGTEKDRQVFYVEQVLLALFLKYYLSVHGFAKYEQVMSDLYEDRLSMILSEVESGNVWKAVR